MADEKHHLPARVEEVLGVAERLAHFLQTVSRGDQHDPSLVRGVITQLDAMERELRGQLVGAMFERNRLTRRIARASESERELRRLVAPFARAGDTVADLPPGAVDALREARRLRDDIAAWEDGAKEAAEVVQACRDFEALLQESRAGLRRASDAVERRLRAADTKLALARLADRLGIMERTVRDALTAADDLEARGDTAHEAALGQEELRMRELYRLSGNAEMEEELRRLREDPP